MPKNCACHEAMWLGFEGIGSGEISDRTEWDQVLMERAMGVEPTSLAWEARVIAVIRRPQRAQSYRGLSDLWSGATWRLP